MSKQPQTRVVVRSSRTSFVILLLAAAAIAGLVLGWFRCGGAGWFGGGQGTSTGSASAATDGSAAAVASAAPSETPAGPCALRLDATGLTLDGRAVTPAQALAACRPAGEAILHVVGDTPFGAFERLRDELERGGVRVTTRSPRAEASAAPAPSATSSATATP
ncbi:MAG: hypothetical protein IT373_32885 [Polyangiaceae bacterium]|nr:hypothetical protein [Polyangiaceae bacterium]